MTNQKRTLKWNSTELEFTLTTHLIACSAGAATATSASNQNSTSPNNSHSTTNELDELVTPKDPPAQISPQEEQKKIDRRRLIRSSSDPEKLLPPEERAALAAAAEKQAAAAAAVAAVEDKPKEEVELPKKGLDKSLRKSANVRQSAEISTGAATASTPTSSPVKSSVEDLKEGVRDSEETPALTITNPLSKQKSDITGDASSDPIIHSRQRPRVLVPKTLLTEIWNENSEFLIRKHLFDGEYFNFLWSIVNLAPQRKRTDKSKAAQDLDKLREKVRKRKKFEEKVNQGLIGIGGCFFFLKKKGKGENEGRSSSPILWIASRSRQRTSSSSPPSTTSATAFPFLSFPWLWANFVLI